MVPLTKNPATTTHSTHLATATNRGVQMSLSTGQQSPESKGHSDLALLISQLPINLVMVKPDLPVKQDEREGLGGGEGEEMAAHGEVDVGRSKLTAAKKKTEWGPLISHCYSCYWRCVLFTLKQLHSLDRDSSCGHLTYSYGDGRAQQVPCTNTDAMGGESSKDSSCGLTYPYGSTERAPCANTDTITSKSSEDSSHCSPSHGSSSLARCSSGQPQGQGGQALIPISSNDTNALIEVCLSSGLDLADDEVPTVIQCLCLLLPQVCKYMYVHVYDNVCT